ncbi:MAG: tRNA (guanine(10)-N(2))-dimethyltransferase [Candidatus Bathyarchaeota archaeon]|nr:tRNA (guanine(10)-N(2))-dimethyltransferase [Candidatus Bathyarchaeota archaeon]
MSESLGAEFPVESITEGKVKVVVPNLNAYGVVPSDYAPSRAPVFYNPIMEFNRDVSVLAFQAYQRMVNREVTICEPLSATGIRGLRYAAEIQGVAAVVSGDINMRSVTLAVRNVELNNLQNRVTVEHKDANRLLMKHSAPKTRFDIIDIDPFGTPAPHLEAAVQALRNNGLLAATATDMAPLCGVHAKACIRKYGGRPLRTEYCQELAIRLLTGSIATSAAKHDVGVRVLFSHCSDHYIRVYAQIGYGCQKADAALKQMGYILHCFNCLHRETAAKPFPDAAAKCPECGAKMDWAGPLWTGKIFDAQFTDLMANENLHTAFRNSSKITKLLSTAKQEADMPPTYYVLDRLSGKFKLPAPSTAAFFGALQEGGFKAVATHFNSRGIRTDASASEMHNILKTLTPKTQ